MKLTSLQDGIYTIAEIVREVSNLKLIFKFEKKNIFYLPKNFNFVNCKSLLLMNALI
jgi:hypothetical protein